MLGLLNSLGPILMVALVCGHPGMAGVVVLDAASGKVLEADHADVAAAPPGSALKPFTALALLDAGFPDKTTLVCPRTLRVSGRKMDCTHPQLAAPVDLAVALAYSCNYFFVRASRRLDAQRLVEALRGFGFEARPAATEEQLQLQAIGQWGVQATPMQMAQAYRRLARSGSRLITAALEGATEFGTAQLAAVPGVPVAGKTGTAPQAWFAGWAPAQDARVIVVAFLPSGRGGADAAPLARAAFGRYLGVR
jgi:cell division protein FtsI/penicillin-binding protein 2